MRAHLINPKLEALRDEARAMLPLLDISALRVAQLQLATSILVSHHHDDFEYGDDGHDEIRGALKLAARLMEADLNGDVEDIVALWTDELNDYSVEGICSAIWATKPPALRHYDEDSAS